MKKVLFVVTLSVLFLTSCSHVKKQEVAKIDSTAVVVDTTASVNPETETVINEIDSTSNEVDKLVNQI